MTKPKKGGIVRRVLSLLLSLALLSVCGIIAPEARAVEKTLTLTPGRYVRWRKGLPPQDGNWHRVLLIEPNSVTEDYFVCGNTLQDVDSLLDQNQLVIKEEQGALKKALPNFDVGSDVNYTLNYMHTPAARFAKMDNKNNHDSPAPMYDIRLADWSGNDGNLTNITMVPTTGSSARFTDKESVPWAFVGYEHDDDVDEGKYVIEQFRTGGIGGASWDWYIGVLLGQKSAVVGGSLESWIMTSEFYVYYGDEIAIDTIADSQVVEDGEIVNIAKNSFLTLAPGYTLTVKDGGILSIAGGLYNDGTIRVEKGGTLIVQEGAFIMPQNTGQKTGSIVCDGGDVIIYSGGRVVCEGASGFKFAGDSSRYGTVYNYGAIITSALTATGKARSFHNEGSVMLGYTINNQNAQAFRDGALTISGGRLTVAGLKTGSINTDKVTEGVITGNGVIRT